jgi:hypothetical protein
MKLPLFTEVKLTTDLPNYHLQKGCSAIIVDHAKNSQEDGYLLEILDQNNQGCAVIAVTADQIEPVIIGSISLTHMSNYTHHYNRFSARLLRWLDIAPDLQGYISEMLPL